MNLAVYSELPLDDSRLREFTALIPTEISLEKRESESVTWPFLVYGSDVWDREKVEGWVTRTFTEPSLIYTRLQYYGSVSSSIPANGVTIHNASFVSICIAADTPNVPLDIIQRTTIHELGHLAQNLTGDFEALDRSKHCIEPSCLMNSTTGVHPTTDSVFSAIRKRTTERCSRCGSVWRRAFQMRQNQI